MKYDDSCRAPRHPLVADAVVTDIQSGIQISERTKDLSRSGAGTRIMLKGDL
jgi:hypothetical protein